MWRQRLLKYRFGAPWQPFHNLHLLFLGLNKQKKKRTKGRLVRAFHQQASNVTYCGNKRLPRIFFFKKGSRRLAWVTDVRTWELTDLLPTCAYGFLKHFWHAFTSRIQKKAIHSVHLFLFFSYNLQTNFLLFIQMQKIFTFHCTMSLWSQKMIFTRTSNLNSVSTELVQAMYVGHNLEITHFCIEEWKVGLHSYDVYYSKSL